MISCMISGKGKIIGIDFRSARSYGWEEGIWGNFLGDRTVLCLDYGVDYMTVCIFQKDCTKKDKFY